MKIARKITINAPADRVWKVVAHAFADVGLWASGIAHSVVNEAAAIPEGASVGGRVCNVPGFGEILESFTAYDEAGKTFTFEATGGPFIVRSAQSTWLVRALGANTTQVSFQSDLKLLPGIGLIMAIPMRMQLSRLLQNVVEELKYYVETGEIHPRKLKIAAQAKQQVAVH